MNHGDEDARAGYMGGFNVQNARRSRPLPPAQPDWAALASAVEARGRRADEYLDRAGELLDAAQAGGGRPAWLTPDELTRFLHGLRQVGGAHWVEAQHLGRFSVEQTLNDMEVAVERGAGFRQGAMASGGRHRASRNRRPGKGQLMLITGGVAASLVAGTAATGGFSDLANFSPSPAAHHASSLPDVGPVVAAPISVSPVQQGYVPRHAKPSVQASGASQVPSSAPVIVAAPPSSLAPSPTPSVTPSGTLNVATVTCDATVSGGCQITFTAIGDASWSAQPSDPALSLDVSGGTLSDGQPQVISVIVARGSAAGSGYVTLMAGGQQENIPVRWETVPG